MEDVKTRGFQPFRQGPAGAPNAVLDTVLPEEVTVGTGNVLVLDGRIAEPAGGPVIVTVGDNSARPIYTGTPAPGEVVGSGHWRAIVPLAAIESDRDVPVAVDAQEVGRLRLRGGPSSGRAIEIPGDVGREGLVAICMATYEPDQELLEVQLDSIRAQSHANWLCIVSDDASSTVALTALEDALAGDPRFVLLRNARRAGFYRNFERALAAVPAEAAYVALADQDDRWNPDKLATLVAALGNGTLVHSDARVVGAGGEVVSSTFWPNGPPGGDQLGDLLLANTVTGASCLFGREVLEAALPFPALAGNPFHDRWLALVGASIGTIKHVDRPLYDYVQHGAASLGHDASVARGARLGRIRDRAASLGDDPPNWRAAAEGTLSRSISEAIVLRLRFADRLGAADLRALRRIERMPSSALGLARLAAAHAWRTTRRRGGLHGALLRGIAWPRLAKARSAIATRRRINRRPPPLRVRRNGVAARVGITVTSLDPAAAFGDLYTATELGEALKARGLEVEYLEMEGERWRHECDRCDLVISLHDRLPADQLPAGVSTCAWVRNWADRWIDRPWFAAYDTVFASSQASVDRIADRAGRPGVLMPLATNPDRFTPSGASAKRCDVLFAGNRWGSERDVESALPRLPSNLEVMVYGRGWEGVRSMERLVAGAAEYGELPGLYRSAQLVVDDSAHHAKPFAAVNSRVFDAIAAGAIVASNDEAGVRALFGPDFPVWTDADTLAAVAREAVQTPTRLETMFEEFRSEVLARHTYAHRARQIDGAFDLTGVI